MDAKYIHQISKAFLINCMVLALCGCDNNESLQQEPEIEKISYRAVNNTKGPHADIAFSEKVFDFGDIQDSEEVTHTFKFINKGDAPLLIQDVSAGCGCTVPYWSKDPVPVGESGEIRINYTKKGDPGQHQNTIIVTANTNPSYSTLKIKANLLAKS